MAELEKLDDQTARADAYSNFVTGQVLKSVVGLMAR